MRIRVVHHVVHRFLQPATHGIHVLRLTPRSHDGQFVCRWRIEIDTDCRLDRDEDAHGNLTHTFSLDGPLTALRLSVEGEVECDESDGVVRAPAERLPLSFYLRSTAATDVDAAVHERARGIADAEGGDPLATLHGLLRAHHGDRPPADTAETAWRTHAFLGAARAVGIPARAVSGYLYRSETEFVDDAETRAASGHLWAEAHVAGLGWTGFDPALGLCVGPHHVRVATGLDAVDVSPVRFAYNGGAGLSTAETVLVEPASRHHAARAAARTVARRDMRLKLVQHQAA